MKSSDIAQARLSNQFLGKTKCKKPHEVVAWLGAIQAQDFPAAKWALGLRMHDAIDAAIETRLRNDEKEAVRVAADGYGAFLELPVVLSFK